MSCDAFKKYWEPVVQSVTTTVPQIVGSYKDPIYTLVKYDGNNIVTFIQRWCEMLWAKAEFRKRLSGAGFVYLEPEAIISDLLGSNAGISLEMMEAKSLEGKIRFVRAHHDMGNGFYGKWLQEQGLRQSMGEVKAGDMVEALLSFNWWQERAGQRLDMMGNMSLFHQELQKMLLTAKARYQEEEPGSDKPGFIWSSDKDEQEEGTPGGSPAGSAEEQKGGKTMQRDGGRPAGQAEKEQENKGTGSDGSTTGGYQVGTPTDMEKVVKTVLESMAKKEGKQSIQQPDKIEEYLNYIDEYHIKARAGMEEAMEAMEASMEQAKELKNLLGIKTAREHEKRRSITTTDDDGSEALSMQWMMKGTGNKVDIKELSVEESKPYLRLRGVTVKEEVEPQDKEYKEYGELIRMMTNMLRHGVPMAMGIMVEYFVGVQTLIDCINQVEQLSFKVALHDVLYAATTSVMKDGKLQFEVFKLKDPEHRQEEGEAWIILRSRPEAGRPPTLLSTGVRKTAAEIQEAGNEYNQARGWQSGRKRGGDSHWGGQQ